MPKVRVALLCARVLIDQESNLLSYIDAVDGLTTEKFPFAFPPLFVCLNLKRESEEADKFPVFLRVLDPDGKIVVESTKHPLTADFRGRRTLRLNIQLARFDAPQAGLYTFVVYTVVADQEQELARVECDISVSDGGGGRGGAPAPAAGDEARRRRAGKPKQSTSRRGVRGT